MRPVTPAVGRVGGAGAGAGVAAGAVDGAGPAEADRPVRTAAGEAAPPNPPLIATDLDRTLIYSAAALELPAAEGEHGPQGAAAPEAPAGSAGPGARTPRLRCVELYDGEPLSYMTETAARLLAQLAERAVLVPATTRTREQYARIRLPGPPPRYAVCANGGHLLVDGRSDPDWHARVRCGLAECAPLADVRDRLRSSVRGGPARNAGAGGWLLKERVAEDLFAYLVVDRDRMPGEWLAELADWARPRGWTVSLQGRKVYAVPRALSKSAAVAEIARRTGAAPTYAAGDSLLDADLLLAADAGWRPGHGELRDSGWQSDHITALPERGVLAGERILCEMNAAATGHPPAAVPLSRTDVPLSGTEG